MSVDLKLEDLGFPEQVDDQELRNRLKFAVQNRRQIDSWIDAVTKELMRRSAAARTRP